MTIHEAIAQVDRVKPNQYETAEKVRWLARLDGLLASEIMSGREGAPEGFAAYDPDGDLDAALLVPEPYTEIYGAYLCAQIDYHNGELARYNNSMVTYNMALSAFADWYNRTHRAAQRPVRVSL